jgi:hypothetical protein
MLLDVSFQHVVRIPVRSDIRGSLWTSIVKPGVFLSGGSGGVYALIMSHLGTVIMNHRYNDAF